MPEEIEVPTEHLHETLKEEAEREGWVAKVALSAAVLAVLAAIAALLAGHHANEGVLESIRASDRWSYYQAKGIKLNVLSTKIELLRELDRAPKATDEQQVATYKSEQGAIEEEAHELERSSNRHMADHNVFARTVTILQIAIALAAISVLAKRRWLWFASMALTVVGLVSMIPAFL